MPYAEFARYYDALNTDADYGALMGYLSAQLEKHSIKKGIVADLGCGTGEASLRLAARGYDVIAIDASPDMLSVLREKCAQQGAGDILLLCQNLAELDLYGTIGAAISTFDTFNHLNSRDLQKALQRVSLFTEPGGLLLFDVNTEYKHREILGDYVFEAEAESIPGVVCVWENCLDEKTSDISIELTLYEDDRLVFADAFTEYCYTPLAIEAMLQTAGYIVESLVDGESFGAVHSKTQRLLYTAVKIR